MVTVVNLVVDAVGVSTWEYLLDRTCGNLKFPNFAQLGLGNLLSPKFNHLVPRNEEAQFAHALIQASAAADSVIGHREMMGVIDDRDFPLFYDGFSADFVQALEEISGRGVMNIGMESGSAVPDAYGEKHEESGDLILYASTCDPLFQIAANVDVVDDVELADIVDKMFSKAWGLGIEVTRGISRPYENKEGKRERLTSLRHDAVLPLRDFTLIDVLEGVRTVSVGKPYDLVKTDSWDERARLVARWDHFCSAGRVVYPTDEGEVNPFMINALRRELGVINSGDHFIFANLVDTDSKYGHNCDVSGALGSLHRVDQSIPHVIEAMRDGDILIVSADHGMRHEDWEGPRGLQRIGYHSIEPLPLLAMRKGGNREDLVLYSSDTLVSVGYMIAHTFGLEESFKSTCNLK
jgi:phosphopentomutase